MRYIHSVVCSTFSQSKGSIVLLQLCVEEVYVLAILENDKDKRNDLLRRFTEIAVNNSYHLQPG